MSSSNTLPTASPSVAGDTPPSSARRALVIGNWKMNGTVAANERLLGALRAQIDASLLADVDVGVCPPFPYLSQAASWLAETGTRWGAQDVARTGDGAYTGEVSAAMLADLRCTWVLVGHSERRQLFGETDADVAAKVAIALEHGLSPVICVGETLAQRESDVTEQVLGAQLRSVIPALAGVAPDRYVLAYEPVWAIGTGRTASPAQAQAVHGFLRASLGRGLSETAGMAGEQVAARVRMLYGGSVKASNAAELFGQPDVDGGLIGGAALVADDFVAICRAAAARASGAGRAP
ncbi:MAG: triose-phosphate isomerase [Lautropia sp.]